MADQRARPKFVTEVDDAYLLGVVLAGELTMAKSETTAPKRQGEAAPDDSGAAPHSSSVDVTEGDTKVFCRVSGIWLDDAAALREHCHTDWYRFNLKRSLRGLPPLDEAQFEELVETDALDDELSGSESEGDDDDLGDEATSAAARPDGRIALRDVDGAVFLVWRAALLPPGASAADVPLNQMPQCLRALGAMRPRPVWVVVLCRGDHFAAAVFELLEPPKKAKKPEEAVKVLTHKCFHRYITRRKAGGRQSTADGSKSIKSAGSMIRRHNEAMMSREIRDLLHSWAPTHLRVAHLIWVAAPGPANSAVLYQGADAPLTRGDGRVRTIPFQTARPTLAETTRTALRLGRLDYLSKDESQELLKQGAPVVTSEEEAAERARAAAAIEAAAQAEAARRAATAAEAEAAAVAAALAEAEANALPSELHEASAAGNAELVADLLAQESHDPTLKHIRFGFRVPYDVAKTKEVRNAFRRARAQQPDLWNWVEAHVPDALTEEAELEKEERAKEKAREKKKRADKARKERRKAEDAARAEALDVLRAATEGEDSEKLAAALKALLQIGGGGDAGEASESTEPNKGKGGNKEVTEAIEAANQKLAQLNDPDWQRKRERERRAEAAEKRLGGLTAAQQRFLRGEPAGGGK